MKAPPKAPPKAPLSAIPQDIVALSDYAPYARERLSDMVWDYLDAGAGDEITVRANEAAFGRYRLRPRVLTDMAGAHTRLSLFGQSLAHPIMVAPMGMQKLFHTQAERAMAQGCAVTDTPLCLSNLASVAMEEVAATGVPLWFQLYVQRDLGVTRAQIARAQAAGCYAVVITVDAPVAGLRNREQRAGFTAPADMACPNLPPRSPVRVVEGESPIFAAMGVAPLWADIEAAIAASPLPVFLKGILCAEDARRAFAAGAAGIVVSNHGGRILDRAPASLEVLPEIVAVSEGPVLIDGGIRRGADVFTALALGASAVLVGRPLIWALATAGALGVAHALRTLREELELTMALCGCRTLTDITASELIRTD